LQRAKKPIAGIGFGLSVFRAQIIDGFGVLMIDVEDQHETST